MKIQVRNYNPETDYQEVLALYSHSENFGGQFDEARDSEDKLRKLSEEKPDCILVAKLGGNIVGTVTLFEDGRSAWLYRFAVQKEFEEQVTNELASKALKILKERGHSQVLVYTPVRDKRFEDRYKKTGFNKGNNFTAYWQDIN